MAASMYICICNGVTDRDIRKCVAQGACSLPELQMELGIATQCGRCQSAAREILEEQRDACSFMPQAA
jgi:bacterioferritin-associated ferredoxin